VGSGTARVSWAIIGRSCSPMSSKQPQLPPTAWTPLPWLRRTWAMRPFSPKSSH